VKFAQAIARLGRAPLQPLAIESLAGFAP